MNSCYETIGVYNSSGIKKCELYAGLEINWYHKNEI